MEQDINCISHYESVLYSVRVSKINQIIKQSLNGFNLTLGLQTHRCLHTHRCSGGFVTMAMSEL